MENSEISENHLKAIVGRLQVPGRVRVRQVPIYRHDNRGGRMKSGENGRSRLALAHAEC